MHTTKLDEKYISVILYFMLLYYFFKPNSHPNSNINIYRGEIIKKLHYE